MCTWCFFLRIFQHMLYIGIRVKTTCNIHPTVLNGNTSHGSHYELQRRFSFPVDLKSLLWWSDDMLLIDVLSAQKTCWAARTWISPTKWGHSMSKTRQNLQQQSMKYAAEICGYTLDFCHVFHCGFFQQNSRVCIALEHSPNVLSAGGHICTTAQSEKKPLLVHPFLFASLQNSRNYCCLCTRGSGGRDWACGANGTEHIR